MIRTLTITAVLLATSAPAFAEAPAAQTAAPQKTGATAAVPKLEPHGYTYDPDGRRDPFVSLMRRGSDSERTPTSSRPAGLAGLGASDVIVKGIVASQGGFVAILQGADNKTYIVHAGDKLLDGTVRAISANSMLILQQVNDPLSSQKQREVRKLLRQTEEAK